MSLIFKIVLTAIASIIGYNYPFYVLGAMAFCWFYKPMRWYIMSYHFPYLYENRSVAKFLGIQFMSDQTFKTNRRDTKLYMSGAFVKFFEWFTGMSVSPLDAHRKGLMLIQGQHAKELNFKPYFDKWEDDRRLSGTELEDELSNIVLEETNRVFKVLNAEQMEEFRKHLKTLRIIVNGLTGGEKGALRTLWKNFGSVLALRRLLLSISGDQRMLMFTPQLTFVNNFARMIILREATINDDWKFELKKDVDYSVPREVNFDDLEPNQFLLPTSFYFVLVVNGKLTFVSRQRDYNNTSGNKAFGPMGFQCPGKHYTIMAIKSVISFFQAMTATIEGEPRIRGGRFPDVANKNEIFMTFHKKGEYVEPEAEVPVYAECDGSYQESSVDEGVDEDSVTSHVPPSPVPPSPIHDSHTPPPSPITPASPDNGDARTSDDIEESTGKPIPITFTTESDAPVKRLIRQNTDQDIDQEITNEGEFPGDPPSPGMYRQLREKEHNE